MAASPSLFDQYVFPILLPVLGAIVGVLIDRYLKQKQEKLKKDADNDIYRTYQGISGGLRQGDKSQAFVINNPTFNINELTGQAQQVISIYKRDNKTKSILRVSERKNEIGQVKFTYI